MTPSRHADRIAAAYHRAAFWRDVAYWCRRLWWLVLLGAGVVACYGAAALGA